MGKSAEYGAWWGVTTGHARVSPLRACAATGAAMLLSPWPDGRLVCLDAAAPIVGLLPGDAHAPPRRGPARRLPRRPRRRSRVLRAGRELSGGARRAARQQRHPDRDLPARERRRLHGRGRRQADGAAGRSLRQPRARRHQRVDRRARGRAGRGAAGAVRRPGAALARSGGARSRRWTTPRPSPTWPRPCT